ncbi:hypothetical protein BGW80DRAFT_529531 [Lactifluus volemus]|nr:hypothetical protein BGW80DRAFT_529531 [Lactifluus volemus]
MISTTIMNVRKLVESYEQESLGRPRLRSHTSSQVSPTATATQRSLRTYIVKEEGPATAVLKDCTNGFQFEQTPNSPHLSVSLSPDTTTRTLGHHPSMTSAKLICSVLPPPPSAPLSGVPVRPAQQRRANLRARRQQRYSRDESALAAALRRSTEYERVIPPRPPMQYATLQFEARIKDAKARLADARDLLRDDSTDQVSHRALLRTRWMAERWIAIAEKELARVTTPSSDHSLSSQIIVSSARKARRDANLAHFFTHSPTRTPMLSAQRPVPGPFEQPRRISKLNVEPPLLRTWPLTTTLREPMNLKGFRSSPSSSQISGPSLQHVSSSPKQPHPHELEMNSPLSQPSSLSCKSNASTSTTTLLHTPVDDSGDRIWPGFALIHTPHNLLMRSSLRHSVLI